MDLTRLLETLEMEAQEKAWLDRKRKAMQPPRPAGRADANIAKIRQLRHRTNQMRYELESNRRLEAETKRNQEAALALYLSNMTPAEKKERDEDTATDASVCCAVL